MALLAHLRDLKCALRPWLLVICIVLIDKFHLNATCSFFLMKLIPKNCDRSVIFDKYIHLGKPRRLTKSGMSGQLTVWG